MSSSSSVGSRSSNRRVMNRLRSRCFCGDPVGKWTLWTPFNLGRRFIGCPNYQDALKDCKFFQWVDPPLPNQWYANLLLEFQNNVNLENNTIFGDYGQQVEGNFFEDIVEQPVAQPLVANQPMEGVAIQVQNGEEGGKWKSFFYVFMVSFVFVLVMLKDL
ncbi:hypothetical protein Lser_V15G20427 [Lactuca serriola]